MAKNISTADGADGRGLYDKFSVTRNDGTDRPGDRHESCSYFVLDLTHDYIAPLALFEYAKLAEVPRPVLAEDLYLMLSEEHGIKLDPHQAALAVRAKRRRTI